MFHYVARARVGTVLFRTWDEGLRLFNATLAAFPGLLGACVMPDHIHLLLGHGEGGRRLGALMSGYARFRNVRRGTLGVHIWQRAPPPEFVEPDKRMRNLRYVHLNPCRKGLVQDPLAWPLSTHRDFVGLSARSELIVANPERLHAYISGDPSVDPAGTRLPEVQYDRFDFFAVRDAVSAVSRTLAEPIPVGAVRTLLVRAASAHRLLEPGGLGTAALAAIVMMSQSQVQRLSRDAPPRNGTIRDQALAAAVRVVGDARFGPLFPGELFRVPGWGPYRSRR